jgi:hypothetical protein
MFTTMLVLGLIAGAGIVAGLVQFRRDGYRRTPTLAH